LLVASKYQLAPVENRLMIEYLLQEDESQDDGRYRLARLLLNDEVAGTFDVALIDAPPRLTAATINGFCASTHLLIPTVYDKLSAEAIGTFLNGVQTMKAHLNSGIDLLGVVGMLTATQVSLRPREQNARNTAMDQVARVWGPNYHFFERHIPRREDIAKAAGEDIAYYCDETVRRWFDELGSAISQRLWHQEAALAAAHEAQRVARQLPRSVRTAIAPAE
jgi:chromosome partitioning protein